MPISQMRKLGSTKVKSLTQSTYSEEEAVLGSQRPELETQLPCNTVSCHLGSACPRSASDPAAGLGRRAGRLGPWLVG